MSNTITTCEIVSHEEFINHYGFMLGSRLTYLFNQLMGDTISGYDGDSHPEHLEYLRSANGLYWVRWNGARGHDQRYRWHSPNGHSGIMTAEAASLACFSCAANWISWVNVQYRNACIDIYRTSLEVIRNHPEAREIFSCND